METINLSILIITSISLFLLVIPLIIKMIKLLFGKKRFRNMGSSSQIRLIKQLYDAAEKLSRTKTGALITILNKQDINNLRTDGLIIDANISSSLIEAIFNKNSPIHDGAIIIDNNKISYAGTYYKITSKSIDNRFGARHRAAIGISEQTDSLTIVVSEETGNISFVKEGKVMKVKISDFQEKIIHFLK